MRSLPLAILAAATLACARPRVVANDYGIAPCPADAEQDFLSPLATQCWFYASGAQPGTPAHRWRILSHDRHLEALVLYVETRDHRDGEAIARRIVANQSGTFGEIIVYARREGPPPARTRRVIWTRRQGFIASDFTSDSEPRQE